MEKLFEQHLLTIYNALLRDIASTDTKDDYYLDLLDNLWVIQKRIVNNRRGQRQIARREYESKLLDVINE